MKSLTIKRINPYFNILWIVSLFIHRTPNTWTPPPHNSASSLAQTRSRLLDAYMVKRGQQITRDATGNWGVLVGQPQKGTGCCIQLPNLFVFRMLLFLSKIYSWIIGTCWRSLGLVEEEHIKAHRLLLSHGVFSQRWTMRTHFELYRYALDFKHIRWESDRHDMDLHKFVV